jgi:hypothetical protein
MLVGLSAQAHAKEYTFLAEITPPYSYLNNNGDAGIYKDILDNVFRDSKHTYVLNNVNTKTLITAMRNKEFNAVIGVSTYAPYYSGFKATILIGSISLNPITANNYQFSLPYTQSLSSKKVGAVYGVGFDQLLPGINLITYRYAQQGVVKLFKNEVEVIIEDPLIIKCTSDSILGMTPSNKILYLHSPPIKSIDLYIGLFERDQQIIDMLNKGTKTVNINKLAKTYSEHCNKTGNLRLNK